MTLKQLEALLWAARLGSFALAAHRLCMTQSTLSKRILELEAELGETLFDRSGAHARITAAGERVLRQAEQMIELKESILTGNKGPQGLRGTCRFGVGELVATTWLADVVSAANQRYPEVTLEPRVAVTQELLAGVLHGDIALAVVPRGPSDPSIASLHLHEVPMIWTSAPELPQSSQVLTRESLADATVVSTTSHSGATAALETWALLTGMKFKRIISCNSMGAVAALTAAGLGICVLPEPFARRFLRSGRLVQIRATPATTLPALPYFLHWRSDDTGLVTSHMRDLISRIGSAPQWPV